MWRSVTSPALHHIAYILLIAVEVITELTLWVGAAKCFRTLPGSSEEFNASKDIAVWGAYGRNAAFPDWVSHN